MRRHCELSEAIQCFERDAALGGRGMPREPAERYLHQASAAAFCFLLPASGEKVGPQDPDEGRYERSERYVSAAPHLSPAATSSPRLRGEGPKHEPFAARHPRATAT